MQIFRNSDIIDFINKFRMDGIKDVVKVLERTMVPLIHFPEASNTTKLDKSRDSMAIELALSVREGG